MSWKRYRKMMSAMAAFSTLFGCSQNEAVNKNEVTVCLLMGDHFIARSYVNTAERGQDITFQYTLLEGYEAQTCSYSEKYSIQQDDTKGTLTLYDVKYSCRVSLECILPQYIVNYDYNGGTLDGQESQKVYYRSTVHPRINTSVSAPEKDGYCLTGWNTQSDGQGLHIGLGSRLTLGKNEETTLYAQWEKETPASLFDYESKEDGIHLLKYLGNEKKIVLPSKIDGQPVVTVAGGFAADCAIESLILPDTVTTIEENAFDSCDIQDFYFYDSMVSVADASFSSSLVHTWHINAEMAPRYQNASDISVFADKMDLLMLNEDKKKLVLFAGCSVFYGLDSKILATKYTDYTVLNMGAVGGTNATFQFDCIANYLKEDDVFVHAPEQASSYQLMADVDCENRVFVAVEGNFDLLTLTDMSKMKGSFDCFSSFNHNRRLLEACTYEDGFSFNEYGDNTKERLYQHHTAQITEGYGFYEDLISEESLDTLCEYYDAMKEKGVSVYASYAPINVACVVNEHKEAFASRFEDGLEQRGYQVISDVDDYVMDQTYFYDTDYHLTNEGAGVRAQLLSQDLEKVLLA